jgi:UTP--glucose-1-phosphate uridylyltransferase
LSERIDKVVFPVAGLGTRFLPATKATPKEMLPVVDKPLIQYAAEEAVAAGAKTLIFVTGRNKEAIADHFDAMPELEGTLEAGGKHALLDRVRKVLPDGVDCLFVRQPRPLGLGHAILCARAAVGDEPFGVILPDDLIHAEPPGTLASMADIHERTGSAVVAVQEVPREQTGRYGIVSVGDADGRSAPMEGIVEKPDPESAPSNLAVVGRYVLPAEIMDILADTPPGAGGEIQVTDAIETLLGRSEVLAYRFPGVRYDCGNKLGYVEATVRYALDDPELSEEFGAFLKSITASNGS